MCSENPGYMARNIVVLQLIYQKISLITILPLISIPIKNGLLILIGLHVLINYYLFLKTYASLSILSF